MSIPNRGLSEGLKYKPISNIGRIVLGNVNDQNDVYKISSELGTIRSKYEVISPLHGTVVKLSDDDENGFSVQQDFLDKYGDLRLNFINNKIKEQKLRIQYFSLLENINSLHKECEEEGYEVFSEIAKINAKDVLYYVCCKFPNNEYFIYPTEDREIAIDCNPVDKRGVLILCDSNGGIACFVTIDGKNSRCRYDKYSDFPYDFLWQSFRKIENTYYPDKIHDVSNIPTMDNPEYVLQSLSEKYRPVELSNTAKVAI